MTKSEYSSIKGEEELRNKIVRAVTNSIASFSDYVSDLYKVSAEYPTLSKDELLIQMKQNSNIGNGYGRGRELSSEERKKIEQEIQEVQASLPEIKFANSNQTDIAKYCKKVLDLLEKREASFL
jgi:hypothetical protein